MLIEIVAIFLALVFLTSISGMSDLNPIWLLDFPSLVGILILTVPVFFRKGMWREFMTAVKLLRKKFCCSLGEMKKAQYAVELMQKQLLWAGVIHMVFSLIFVLTIISDLAQLGPCISIGLLSILYTAALELLLLPLEMEVKRRIVDYMEEE